MSNDDYENDDGGAARSTDPNSSQEAVDAVTVGRLELMYLKALKGVDAWTTTEIAQSYGFVRDSFSPRSQPLIRKGLIERVGQRQVLNSAGRLKWMEAYTLTQKGRAYIS